MANDAKIKSRIATLKSLNSIFSAMQVITVARLSRIKAAQKAAARFRSEAEEAASYLDKGEKKTGEGAVAAVIVSASRGLCGTFNQDLFFRIQSFLAEHAGKEVKLFVFGRKGYDFLIGKKREVTEYYPSDALDSDEVGKLAEKLRDGFRSGGFSEVYVIYNHFVSAFSRKATANRLLPFDLAEKAPARDDMIIEPDRKTLAEKLTLLYIRAMISSAVRESQLGEFSSRMVTLKSAIDNSSDLIDGLTIQRNKARQQMITQEILEIVEASEAMKGEK
ncbi:MAG TPA: F0F1 ATP synthase subunit gamma [Candidatus Omnitrophota bacterium]|nr:F0F1 ATP synthase subunit gamma [Candidatus Omnitrophota bacterium]